MSDYTEIPERIAGKMGLRLPLQRGLPHTCSVNLMDVLADGVIPVSDWTPFDATGNIPAHGWGIDYNDRLGCCGFAGADHGNMAQCNEVSVSGQLYTPPFANLEDAYWAYGREQGEPGAQPDCGVSNDIFVPWLQSNGFAKATVEVPFEYLSWAASCLGGVLLGVALDSDAETDFETSPQTPWGSKNERPNTREGHDIWFVKALPWATDGTAVGEVVTWGWTQPVSADFIEKNVEDVHGIVFRNSPIIDQTKYAAAITALNSL
jgi:hypothetical protein